MKKLVALIVMLYNSILLPHTNNDYVQCTQIADVTQHGKRYKQYVFTDKNSQYNSGYLESYDNPHDGHLFSYAQPMQTSTALIQQPFATQHQQSVNSMKSNCLQSNPKTQMAQVDILYQQKRITDQQAATLYQQINNPKKDGSQEQQSTHHLQLRKSTKKFMQAHDVDTHQFKTVHGYKIQHQLTKEIIEIFDQLSDLTTTNLKNKNLDNTFITQGTQVSIQLCKLAQKENCAGNLPQAISATNYGRGFLHYAQGITLQGLQRCHKIIQAIDCFNIELDKCILALGKGAAQGIVAAQAATMLTNAAITATCAYAPLFAATVAPCIVPIAVIGGCICTCTLVQEFGKLGTLYSTHQMEQFYKQVEQVSMLISSIVWPFAKNNIIRSLQGLQTAHIQLLHPNKLIEKTINITKAQFHQLTELVQHKSLTQFNSYYHKIAGKDIFVFAPTKQVALAGGVPSPTNNELIKLTEFFSTDPTKTVGEKIISTAIGQTIQPAVTSITETTSSQIPKNIPAAQTLATKIVLDREQNNIINTISSNIEIDEIIKHVVSHATVSQDAKILLTQLQDYLVTDHVLPGLADIHDIRQINYFKKITNNFTNIAKLSPAEILHVNYCNWFYPQYLEIQEFTRNADVAIKCDGLTIPIYEVGAYHTFINEMQPGNVNSIKSGGHLFIPEIKTQTLVLTDFKQLPHGYFSFRIKHINDTSDQFALKTFFPYGQTALESTKTVIEAIKNPKHISKFESNRPNTLGFIVKNQTDQDFTIFVESHRITFYPGKKI